MNIVKSGNSLKIYGTAIETFKDIPVKTYSVNFSKMEGFSLVERNDLLVKEKMYGKMTDKIDKVFSSYNITNRNFGIILSGKKGAGKTMLAKAICEKGKDKYNLPVILVDKYAPDLASFLESIEQEVIILFDEFEKIFQETDSYHPQNELLSLFDGVSSGKKMFIITCNKEYQLNEFLLNRPGRFHYHFRMDNIGLEAIKEYLEDNLNEQYKDNIDKIVSLSAFTNITYDYLRAIVFEINQGYNLKDSLEDLNIDVDPYGRFYCTVSTENGEQYTTTQEYPLTIGENREHTIYFYPKAKEYRIYDIYFAIYFNSKDIELINNSYTIKPENVYYEFFTGCDVDNTNADELVKTYQNNFHIKSVSLEQRKKEKNNISRYIEF